MQAKGVQFSYHKTGQEAQVLRSFELQVREGSIYALLGGNGSGKTTALKVLAGLVKCQRGKVTCKGKVVYLPQDPMSLFTELTVKEELLEIGEWSAEEKSSGKEMKKAAADVSGKSDAETGSFADRAEQMLRWMELEEQAQQNPYDLSGGQQQRLALAKILLLEPDVVLLDEPTKGLDAAFKKKLSGLFQDLQKKNITLVLVSHDIEFCAENATHCGLLFDGEIISSDVAYSFFLHNTFYTTAACRMSQGILEDCVVCEDIVERLTGEGMVADYV